MKYGDRNTFQGKENRKTSHKHPHAVKPAQTRYFTECRWLKNKARRIAKALRLQNKNK